MTPQIQFSFQPRWKEELVCQCELGQIVLDMPMGTVSVYVPTRDAWKTVAPVWAAPFWESFYEQLGAWCDTQKIPLHLDAIGYGDRTL
jgi:hypothetical protein